MTCEKKKHVEQMLLSLIKRNDYGCKSTNYSAYRPYKTYFFSLVCTKSIIQQQILSKSKFIYGIYTLFFSLLIFRPD